MDVSQSSEPTFLSTVRRNRMSRQPQDREHDELLAGEPGRPREGGDARGPSAVGAERHGAAGEAGREIDCESCVLVSEPYSLPGLDQCDPKHAERRAFANTKDRPLEPWQGGVGMSGRHAAHDRPKLP